MQARSDIEQNSYGASPFELIENNSQPGGSNVDHAPSTSWNFEISAGNKTIALTLLANHDQASLSDLVPVVHQVCDIINGLTIENENENGKSISCQKGCASCCSYMVSLSSAEAFYLQKHILSLPGEKRRPILHSFLRAARKIAANKIPPIDETASGQSDCLEAISNWYQKLNIKCPFLKDNACSQYQARPLACREHLVTSNPKACLASSATLANIVELPISSAETLMHISNRVESTFEEAVILPLAMVWCNSNSHRGEQMYPSAVLAEHLINAVSTKIPVMS